MKTVKFFEHSAVEKRNAGGVKIKKKVDDFCVPNFNQTFFSQAKGLVRIISLRNGYERGFDVSDGVEYNHTSRGYFRNT